MRRNLARKIDFAEFEEKTAWSESPPGLIVGEKLREFSKKQVLDSLLDSPQETFDDSDSHDDANRGTVVSRPLVPWISSKPTRQSYFISLQKWEGVVLEVLDDSFLARLVDLEHQGPDEEAEILRDELSTDDIPLLNPGAVFYWHIGYHVDRSGQRKRASIIRFRRLPMWTAKEIETAKQEAEKTREHLGWK